MEEIDILDFLGYYLSRIFIVLIIVVLMLVAGNVYFNYFKKPLYKSDTTVILVSEGETNQADLLLNKNLVSTYSNIIKSKRVLNAVIKKLKLKTDYSNLSNMISVSSINDTEIIKISVVSKNNEKAAKIANAIVPIFSEEVERIYGIENVSVLDEAVASEVPYNMDFTNNYILLGLIGLLLGSMIVFIMYYFDTSIKSAATIEENLGLTVLGMVPKIERRN